MSYFDGWRDYEDIPEHIEKRNILMIAKIVIEKQLIRQENKVKIVSESTRKLTIDNTTKKRRSAANMRLQQECECRDTLKRRLYIIEDWLEVIKKEV
jgi:uncharacterized OsmC-like protein